MTYVWHLGLTHPPFFIPVPCTGTIPVNAFVLYLWVALYMEAPTPRRLGIDISCNSLNRSHIYRKAWVIPLLNLDFRLLT
jgi:hypothetical protein